MIVSYLPIIAILQFISSDYFFMFPGKAVLGREITSAR